jgi:hypothetical protein
MGEGSAACFNNTNSGSLLLRWSRDAGGHPPAAMVASGGRRPLQLSLAQRFGGELPGSSR